MISVITTTVRPAGLFIIYKCLSRQTYTNFEWIIISPPDNLIEIDRLVGHSGLNTKILSDPPKKEGDFWTLCKAWNKGYATASGELIVNIQDFIWFQPDTLDKFWNHYQTNPRAIVSAVGHHYDRMGSREPEEMVWEDPRIKDKAFKKVGPEEMEMSMCSVSRQAVIDCGGVDEEYDKGPGVQEKEMCLRLRILGYDTYLDQNIEYKAIHHPRLTNDWDDKYWSITAPMFKKHVQELGLGRRPLNVRCLSLYNKTVNT